MAGQVVFSTLSHADEAKAYGNGVYFARDATTSTSSYSRPGGGQRGNADMTLVKATALVELGK